MAEVGNPTIVATLTVVAALLPMLFVSGLMGPYMSPIPANASSAMILSFFVAVMVTPWLMLRFGGDGDAHGADGHDHGGGWLARAYIGAARPILATRGRAWLFLGLVGVATLLSMMLFATKAVTVKLLPFDNKSELQVVVDLPRGTSLEETDRVLSEAAARLVGVAGTRLDPVLCGHGGAVQLQRTGAPLLLALGPRAGRPADQSDAQGRAQPDQPRRSRSTCAGGSRDWRCRSARRSRWWRCRRGRR